MLVLLALTAAATPLQHVRVHGSPMDAAEARELGLDLIGPVTDDGFELIASADEAAWIALKGLRTDVLDQGAPLTTWSATDPYPPLDEVIGRLQSLEDQRPDLAQLVDVTERTGAPTTAEGRHVFALRISDSVTADEDEPAFLLVASEHSREVVPALAALQAAEWLVGDYDADPSVRELVDAHEIWIAPVWNPDGYAHVFEADRLWRKNRRELPDGEFGVDLNRNFPTGWDGACSGSSQTGSQRYKGPEAASEPETQAMIALATERRFARVLDLHSFGRMVLRAYHCTDHPLEPFLELEAQRLSKTMGYGQQRRPSAEGEHFQWQLTELGAHAFLIELGTEFQPRRAVADEDASRVREAVRWMLSRDPAVVGHVADAVSGAPLEATWTLTRPWTGQTVQWRSGGPFGRVDGFLPRGTWEIEVEASGYQPAVLDVDVDGARIELDVALDPVGACSTAPAVLGWVPALLALLTSRRRAPAPRRRSRRRRAASSSAWPWRRSP